MRYINAVHLPSTDDCATIMHKVGGLWLGGWINCVNQLNLTWRRDCCVTCHASFSAGYVVKSYTEAALLCSVWINKGVTADLYYDDIAESLCERSSTCCLDSLRAPSERRAFPAKSNSVTFWYKQSIVMMCLWLNLFTETEILIKTQTHWFIIVAFSAPFEVLKYDLVFHYLINWKHGAALVWLWQTV